MYRIELAPGDVGVFRSVEEIATAIKSGVVTSRARIYHQATDKWLPIEFHPHYKRALELVAGGGGQASSSPGSSSAPVSSSSTPSGPRAALKIISAPRPRVAVAEPEAAPSRPAPRLPDPEPVTQREPVAREPVAHEPVAHEPLAREPVAHEPVASEPVAHEPVAHEPVALHVPVARAEPLVQPEPVAAPPEPTSALEFIPPDEPLPAPAAVPTPSAGPALTAPDLPVAPAAGAAGDGFPAPEPRPVVRSRLRVELAGKPRRPFVLALGAVAVVLVTQLGLTAAVPQKLGQTLGQGIRSLASLRPGHPDGAPAPAADGAALAATAEAATAQRRGDVEAGGSPSFGSASAFTTAAPTGAAGVPVDPARWEPPAASVQPADSVVAAAPAPGDIAVAAPLVPVVGKPAAGRMTAAALVSRYQAAYAAAQAELETGFRTAGFANLFALDHLDSPKGVQAARLAAGTASAYVARYRRREAEIERVYADSFAVLSKQLNWSAGGRKAWQSRKVLQEKPEVAKLASFLLEQIDSLYGVLSSQEGAYEIRDGRITFQDAAAARAYAEIRPWLDRRANQWADTASGPPTTAARVLRAMGSTSLPEGGAF